MDMQTYRQRVSKPIEGANPVGERLLEDALLDFVEGQMMKVGSLSHTEVQWAEAEQSAFKLMEGTTKDLKLLTHLLQCLQHQASPERFTLSIFVLADFINAYWETCHPAPGPRGVLPRRKFYSQIIQRTEKAADKIDASMFDEDQKVQLDKALNELEAAAVEHDLPTEGVKDIGAMVKRKLTNNERLVQATTKATENEALSTASPSTAANAGKLEIDGSSDRAVKQTLLKVSEFVSELDGGGIALSLRLRRFSVWFSITSAPEAEANGETQLMPPSLDRISEYEEQLNRGADHALWRKVEQSLTVAPYWIDGHFLSYRIALKLGNTEWADTIANETRAFIKRLPLVTELRFKGGAPFVNDETRRWLDEGETSSTGAAGTSDWDAKRKEAFTLADEGGLSVALAMLNDGLAESKEPRDQFYWRMLSADVMRRHQLSAMAEQQYQILLEQTTRTSLVDWEPSLIQRLENIAKAQ
ncbi:type VI secretion system protein TssA [Enterovibrio sp. 27052020O]|uniref:type VI secretion system protein TssA n=1 Tax=Enterovibrio sp. 27052020O TaxID=3241166 RepID=UPI00388E2803